jgi:hypothetical protein
VEVDLHRPGGVAEVPQHRRVERTERAQVGHLAAAVVDQRQAHQPRAVGGPRHVGEVDDPQFDSVARREALEDVAVGRELAGGHDDRARLGGEHGVRELEEVHVTLSQASTSPGRAPRTCSASRSPIRAAPRSSPARP